MSDNSIVEFDVAKGVRDALDSRGIKGGHVVAKLGKHKSWLSERLNNHKRFFVQDLVDIANLLQCSVEEFFVPKNLTESKGE